MVKFKFNEGKTASMLFQEAVGSGCNLADNQALLGIFEVACQYVGTINLIKMVRTLAFQFHTFYEGLKDAKDLVQSYGEFVEVRDPTMYNLEEINKSLPYFMRLSERDKSLDQKTDKITEQEEIIRNYKEQVAKLVEDDQMATEDFKHMNDMIDEYKTKLEALEKYVGIRK
jgi:DNA repair ATPase RecN